MKVHYFYSRNSRDWYDVHLEAILEQDVYSTLRSRHEKGYTYIEEMHIHINKDLREFQCATFEIRFGKDCCHGDNARSEVELLKSKYEDKYRNWKPVTRDQYERIRNVIFKIYHQEKFMQFALVRSAQKYSVRLLDA